MADLYVEKELKRESNQSAEEKQCETCVCCGKKTQVLKSEPISRRKFYIEGGGQLCRDCYYELYGPNR